MSSTILLDLDLTRKRLQYYSQLRTRKYGDTKKTTPADKWIEIYNDRLKRLERQAQKFNQQQAAKPTTH